MSAFPSYWLLSLSSALSAHFTWSFCPLAQIPMILSLMDTAVLTYFTVPLLYSHTAKAIVWNNSFLNYFRNTCIIKTIPSLSGELVIQFWVVQALAIRGGTRGIGKWVTLSFSLRKSTNSIYNSAYIVLVFQDTYRIPKFRETFIIYTMPPSTNPGFSKDMEAGDYGNVEIKKQKILFILHNCTLLILHFKHKVILNFVQICYINHIRWSYIANKDATKFCHIIFSHIYIFSTTVLSIIFRSSFARYVFYHFSHISTPFSIILNIVEGITHPWHTKACVPAASSLNQKQKHFYYPLNDSTYASKIFSLIFITMQKNICSIYITLQKLPLDYLGNKNSAWLYNLIHIIQ